MHTHITFTHPEEVIKKYFDIFLERFKVGIVTSITGSTLLKTGCGKSWTAMRLGEIIDKDFSIEKVCFTPREFLEAIDKIAESGKDHQVVIMDEGEISAPAQLWYSFTNKAIFYTLVTFRYTKSMAIIVTPSLYWIDKRIRTLTSHWGYTEMEFPLDIKKRIFYLRLFQVRTDLFGEKIFFKKLRLYDAINKRLVKFERFKVNPPNESLTEEYEKKAKNFKDILRRGLIKEIEKFESYESKVGEEKKDLKELVNIALEKPLIRKELEEKGKVSSSLIRYEMSEYNLTYAESQTLAKLIKLLWSGKNG